MKLEKIGPFLNSNSEVFILKTDVPKMSEGIRSGVNCILLKSTEIVLARSLAVMVFATPGTPSIRTCPLERRAARRCSIMLSCPTMTFPISAFILSKLSRSSVISILDWNCVAGVSGCSFSIFSIFYDFKILSKTSFIFVKSECFITMC